MFGSRENGESMTTRSRYVSADGISVQSPKYFYIADDMLTLSGKVQQWPVLILVLGA